MAILGAITLIILIMLFIYCACRVSGELTRQEEQREFMRQLEKSKKKKGKK